MLILIDDGTLPALRHSLTVGLVNNMPDAALAATERQFLGLLAAAGGHRTVRVRLLAMPGVERGPQASAHVARHYTSTATLDRQASLDGLIVTGCEPRAAALADEPFWADFTRLVDWAAAHTATTLWSCLAAHAAVLHRDGIARRRLPAKRSGVYQCDTVGDSHPLLAGAAARLSVPHSRWNDLGEADLSHHGYTVLTHSPEAGADLFVKDVGSLFVFFQGHPEYDLDSIAREYRRDIARYLRGERTDYPGLPHGYFDAATATAFAALRERAVADRHAVGLGDLPRQVGFRPELKDGWQSSVVPVFRNWLSLACASHDRVEAA